MTPVLLYASSMAQVFGNTPEDSTPFLIWGVLGFAWFAAGAGICQLLQDVPNRFRPTGCYDPKRPDWRDHLRIQRHFFNGIGAIIGSLGIHMRLYEGVRSLFPSQMSAPLIGFGILITLSVALSNYFFTRVPKAPDTVDSEKGQRMPPQPPPDIEKLQRDNDVNGLITALAYVPDRSIRLAAVEALGRIGGATVVSVLIRAFKNDKFRDLWGAIRQALIGIGPPAVEGLIAELGSGEARAASMLGIIGDGRALIPLIEASQGRSHLRRAATEALGALGDGGAVEHLLTLLDDKDRQVRKAALKALRQFDDPQAKQAVAAIESKQSYQDHGSQASYCLTETILGNQFELEVTTEKFCVYCKYVRDPNFGISDKPKGAGECSHQGSPHWEVGFDDTCSLWQPNSRVRFWLSKGYMEHNREGWPHQPWYPVFDDGPDGEKGTR